MELTTEARSALFNTTTETLGKYGIPWRTWGSPGKNVHDLAKAIREDRVDLVEEGGKLILEVCVSVVWIYHYDAGRRFFLYEKEQIMPDGKKLTREFDGSLGETHNRFPVETGPQAAIRGLEEELGFKDREAYKLMEIGYTKLERPSSEYYTGLPVRYHRHRYKCHIDESLFDPNGHIEVKPNGKQIHFAYKMEKKPEW